MNRPGSFGYQTKSTYEKKKKQDQYPSITDTGADLTDGVTSVPITGSVSTAKAAGGTLPTNPTIPQDAVDTGPKYGGMDVPSVGDYNPIPAAHETKYEQGGGIGGMYRNMITANTGGRVVGFNLPPESNFTETLANNPNPYGADPEAQRKRMEDYYAKLLSSNPQVMTEFDAWQQNNMPGPTPTMPITNNSGSFGSTGGANTSGNVGAGGFGGGMMDMSMPNPTAGMTPAQQWDYYANNTTMDMRNYPRPSDSEPAQTPGQSSSIGQSAGGAPQTQFPEQTNPPMVKLPDQTTPGPTDQPGENGRWQPPITGGGDVAQTIPPTTTTTNQTQPPVTGTPPITTTTAPAPTPVTTQAPAPQVQTQLPGPTGAQTRAESAGTALLDQMNNQPAPAATTPITRQDLGTADISGGPYQDLGTAGLSSAISGANAMTGQSNPYLEETIAKLREAGKNYISQSQEMAGSDAARRGMGRSSLASKNIAVAGGKAANEAAAREMEAVLSANATNEESRRAALSTLASTGGTAGNLGVNRGQLGLSKYQAETGNILQREDQQTTENIDISRANEAARANQMGEKIDIGKTLISAGSEAEKTGLEQQRVGLEAQQVGYQGRQVALQEKVQTGELNLKERAQGFTEQMGIRDRDFQEQLDTRMADLDELIKTGQLDQGQQVIDDARLEANRRYGMDLTDQQFKQMMGLAEFDLARYDTMADNQLEAMGIEQRERASIRDNATSTMQALLNHEVDMTQLGQEQQKLLLQAEQGDRAAERELFMFLVNDATTRQINKRPDSFSVSTPVGGFSIEG